MRMHRKYRPFASWCEPALVGAVARLRYLAAARLEPVVRGLRGGALLDLVCISGDDVAVVPFIEIVPEMLLERESSPFVWPAEAAAVLGEERTEEFERALLPWIESLTLGRQLNAETVRMFGDESACKLFQAARDEHFPGASLYTHVLEDAAPYLYAVRFAEGRRAAVRDEKGAFGSVLLARHAREVRADCGAHRNELARRWFGKAIYGAIEPESVWDVAVCPAGEHLEAAVRITLDGSEADGHLVRVARPVPTDVMVSFDSNESPECRSFAVRGASKTPRESFVHALPAASGGSAGRILMLMRDDYARAPDADTDEAFALASLLRAEGFSVDVAGASAARTPEYDLVHAFTLARANELEAPLAAAQAARVPIVMTPFFTDVSSGGAWGIAIVRALVRVAADETELEDSLTLVAQRRLEAPGLSAKRQEPYPGYDEAARAALRRAGAVLVSGAEEERQLRAFGFTGTIQTSGPCLLADRGEDEPPVRGGDFVLVHAPLEARSNLLLVVRAAVKARVPLVIAGPLVDPEYVLTLREQADEQVTILSEPTASAAERLYRSARVYADLSWVPYGIHRAFRAAACGAALVVSKDSYAVSLLDGEALWQADPADEAALSIALGDAWKRAHERCAAIERNGRRAAELGDAREALVACVRAYSAAQLPRAPA